MRHVLAVAALVLFASTSGCTNRHSSDPADYNPRAITYIKDDRPHPPICYGLMASMTAELHTVLAPATVPCEAVEHLIGK